MNLDFIRNLNPVLKRFLKGFAVALVVFALNYWAQVLPELAKAGVLDSTLASVAVGLILAVEKAWPNNL